MEQIIKLVVVDSKCDLYEKGDKIIFDGATIDKEKSNNLCMMAMQAVFPFVYAARKGCMWEDTVQCPDCPERVVFKIEKDD